MTYRFAVTALNLTTNVKNPNLNQEELLNTVYKILQILIETYHNCHNNDLRNSFPLLFQLQGSITASALLLLLCLFTSHLSVKLVKDWKCYICPRALLTFELTPGWA